MPNMRIMPNESIELADKLLVLAIGNLRTLASSSNYTAFSNDKEEIVKLIKEARTLLHSTDNT